jgi:uncharacterized membrane protein YraQ (UPF0718 family)
MTRRKLTTGVLVLLAIVLGTLALDTLVPAISLMPALALPDPLQNFVTVFLGIFIEAAPFLLFGSLASGLIAVFVSADDIAAFFPRNRALATMSGALLGIAFPVCECGVVPVVRRLSQKGLPISAGIAFLMAAPVINPVVIASTYAAFGFSPIFWARIVFTFVVAVAVGLVFSAQPQLIKVLRPRSLVVAGGNSAPQVERPTRDSGPGTHDSIGSRLQAAFTIAADDFFDVGRYLVLGSLVAAALQTFVPQSALVSIGRDQVSSVLALQALAYVLSVCSTVDAFLALSFVNTFTAGAIVSFLVFGPMVDIKSTLMFLGLFRGRAVAYIIALTFFMTLLIGVFINLNLSW